MEQIWLGFPNMKDKCFMKNPFTGWLFSCSMFYVLLKNFSLIWRRHHGWWWAAHLGLCSALRAFEQGGIFIVPHFLWHGTSVFPVSSERLPQFKSPLMTRMGMRRTYSNLDPHGVLSLVPWNMNTSWRTLLLVPQLFTQWPWTLTHFCKNYTLTKSFQPTGIRFWFFTFRCWNIPFFWHRNFLTQLPWAVFIL
jgi:hypothetical protein